MLFVLEYPVGDYAICARIEEDKSVKIAFALGSKLFPFRVDPFPE